MAINYLENRDNAFEIINGHLTQLREIQKEYGISNEARTLAFLIAVGIEAKGKPITIDGKIIAPSDEIKKEQ